MKRHLAIYATVLGGLVFGSTAHATEARIDSMGGGVKLWTVEDEANIFDFPSLLVHYGNRVYVDHISPGTEGKDLPNMRFGFHYNLSDETVIAIVGAHMNSTTRGVGDGFNPTGNVFTGSHSLGVGFQASQAGESGGGTASPMAVSGDMIGNADFRYGLMFATMLGAKTRMGISFNVLADNGDSDSPNDAQSDQGSMLFDIGLGFGFDLDGSELELSAGVEFGVADDFRDETSVQTGALGDLLEHNSVSHFGLRVTGRWTFDFFAQTKIVAYTQFLLASQSVEVVNAVAPVPSGSYSGIGFTLGADLRIEPFQDVIVSPGLGIMIAQQTIEGNAVTDRDADLRLGLPFYGVGVDLKLLSWLDMRFGAQQFIQIDRHSRTEAGVTSTTRQSDVLTTFAWGLGLNIPVSDSTLAIDINLNPQFFLNGPHLLTGNATTPFGLTAAVRYNW